jgi:hypothetical protein
MIDIRWQTTVALAAGMVLAACGSDANDHRQSGRLELFSA